MPGPHAAPPEDWLVAHRGYPMCWPENSLAGMAAVLDAGARQVEFDVQISRDGHVLVVHDDDLERVAATRVRVTATTRQALAALGVGEPARFGDRFADVRLPEMVAMLALIERYPGVTVFVDIKAETVAARGARATAEAVLAAMGGVRCEWVILCEHPAVLEYARAAGAPAIGWVVNAWADATGAQTQALRPDYIFVGAGRVPAAGRLSAGATGAAVAVFGVDEAPAARELRERGTSLIETDCWPEMARACRGHEPP